MPRTPISTAEMVASALLLLSLQATASGQEAAMIQLPEPQLEGPVSVETALNQRRSVRELGERLSLAAVGQLLWAAQGVTRPMPAPRGWQYGEWAGGLRTAPSAGALYPLEIYLVAAAVDSLEPGVYHYAPSDHALTRLGDAEPRALASAALGQRAIAEAPAVMVVTGVYRRTAAKYGDRARRYVHIEVGAATENVYLQAEALGLGTVVIGAFRDDRVRQTLGLPADHAPLAIMPIGRPQ